MSNPGDNQNEKKKDGSYDQGPRGDSSIGSYDQGPRGDTDIDNSQEGPARMLKVCNFSKMATPALT